MFNIRTGLLSCALLMPLGSYADSPAVAVVNGKAITQQAYDDYIKARKDGDKIEPKMLIDELVQRELLRQDGIQENLEQNPEFIKKIAETRDNLLMAMAIRNYLEQHPLTDAELKNKYDKQLANTVAPNEYQVKHIQVETEAEAQAIIKDLENKQDFATIAKAKSTDVGSANQGGDLGWITQPITEPEFWAAIEKLKKGKYATAKSKFGWHVIQLNDVRVIEPPKFADVKERIRSVMQSQQMQDYVDGLLKKAKVEILQK